MCGIIVSCMYVCVYVQVVILREDHLKVGLKNLGFHEEYVTRTEQKMSDFGEVKSRKKVRGGNQKRNVRERIAQCAVSLLLCCRE